MSRISICALGAILAASMVKLIPPAEAAQVHPTLESGVDMQYVDRSVRPQDDIYRYLNGKWLDTFQLPADKALYGQFAHITDTTQDQLHGIVEDLVRQGAGADADVRKMADLYSSFMDEGR